MYKTQIKGPLFVYESWEKNNGMVAFHKDSIHLSHLVFYTQSLNMSGGEYLTERQWLWHVACLEAYKRSYYNEFN